MDKVNINELVMIRLPNNPHLKERQPFYNTWVRINRFDGVIVEGVVERIDVMNFDLLEVGSSIGFYVNDILRTYSEGEQFCYSDNVTICDCPGLCRNK